MSYAATILGSLLQRRERRSLLVSTGTTHAKFERVYLPDVVFLIIYILFSCHCDGRLEDHDGDLLRIRT